MRGADSGLQVGQWVVWVNAELVPETPLAPHTLHPTSPKLVALHPPSWTHGFASLPFLATALCDGREIEGHMILQVLRVGEHDWPRTIGPSELRNPPLMVSGGSRGSKQCVDGLCPLP